jgi:ribosomal protein S18 acetylase RimI-like enzyme
MTEPSEFSVRQSADTDWLVAALSDADESDERIRGVVSDPANTSYMLLQLDEPVGAMTVHWDAAESELIYIAIDQARRGGGLGKLALAWLIDEARRRNVASVIVGTGNSGLDQIAFYQKAGFRIDSVRRDYFDYFREPVYDHGIQLRDMLVMRLELGDTARARMAQLFPARSWDVLLIGGASGVGKSSVSYRAARHFGVGIVEVDDFQVVLERLTTPETQPAFHFWRTHPDPGSLTPDAIHEQGLAYGQAMLPALEAVIANHLETNRPTVIEGDFILPALAALPQFGEYANNGRVRAVFIDEPDEAQIAANFLAREPEHGLQAKRARVSWLYNRWLKQEAERLGLISLPARPWDTLFERLLTRLGD